MQIIYTPKAKLDLDYWVSTSNRLILTKILKISHSIKESPYRGIGKPEALRYNLNGYWSRRIT